MLFYATLDNDGFRISAFAHIAAFTARASAEDYLRTGHPEREWKADSLEIGVGRFSDYWIKTHRVPKISCGKMVCGSHRFAPFDADQLTVVRHPHRYGGGGSYWITPIQPVLVVTSAERVH